MAVAGRFLLFFITISIFFQYLKKLIVSFSHELLLLLIIFEHYICMKSNYFSLKLLMK